MKTIKTGTVLTDYKGEKLTIPGTKDEPLTIGVVISVVLSQQTSNPTLAWVLGKKCANDKEVDLKSEEVSFIKKELEATKVYTSLATGQVIEMLEAKEENISAKKK